MQYSSIEFNTWAFSVDSDALFCYEQELSKERREIVGLISLQISEEFTAVKAVLRATLQYAAELDMEISANTVAFELSEIIEEGIVTVSVIDGQKCIKL